MTCRLGRCWSSRSHGVPASVYDRLREREVDCLDATCPFVAKIHRIVERHSSEGYAVLIAGDPEHPEVMGIRRTLQGPVIRVHLSG